MAKKAELKGVLKLDNSQFLRSIKGSVKFVKQLAKDIKQNPLGAPFIAGAIAAEKSLKITARVAQTFARTVKYAAVGAASGIAIVSATILGLSIHAINASADLEKMTKGFEYLLGSSKAAKERLEELSEFSKKSPFEFHDVAEASRILEQFSNGAISSGRNLQIIGDAAAGTQTPIVELSEAMGRLYDNLRSGEDPGRGLIELQKMRVISAETRGAIKQMVSSGNYADAWKLILADMQRYHGAMLAYSNTWEARMKNFRHSIESVAHVFGMQLIDRLKPALAALTNFIETSGPKLSGIAKSFADGIQTGVNVLVHGFSDPKGAAQVMVLTLKAGMLDVGNVFLAAIETAIRIVAGAGFFNGLKNSFWGLAKVFGGMLMQAFEKPMALLMATQEYVMAKLPKALGGNDEVGSAKERLRGLREQSMNALFSSLKLKEQGKFEQADKMLALSRQLDLEIKTLAPMAKGNIPSIGQRADRMISNHEVLHAADDSIKSGEELLKQGTDTLFKNVSDAIAQFDVKDRLHASEANSAAMAAAKAFGASGAKTVADAAADKPDEASPVKETPWNKKGTALGGWNDAAFLHNSPLLGTALNGASMGMSSSSWASNFKHTVEKGSYGSMQGTSLDKKAERIGSLLNYKERRRAEDKRVAELMANGFTDVRRSGMQGTFNSVRSGDHKRMLAVQREKEREKVGIEATNDILKHIQTKFDALVN